MAVWLLFALISSVAGVGLFSRELDRRAVVVFFLSIFAVVAFRYATVDYFSYWQLYDAIDSSGSFDSWAFNVPGLRSIEPGFALMVVLEKSIFGTFFSFVALFSAVAIGLKLWAISEMSPLIGVSVLVYLSELFWKEIGQVRNAFAAGIFLCGVFYLCEGKVWRYVGLMVVASMFHLIAFFAIPFLLVRKLRLRALAFLLCFSLLCAVMGGAGWLLPELATSLGVSNSARIITYASSEHANAVNVFGGGILMKLFFAFFAIFYYEKLIGLSVYNKLVIHLYLAGLSFVLLFHDYGIISLRVNELICAPLLLILVPSCILLFCAGRRIFIFLAILMYCSAFFYLKYERALPYRTIFG
ncbi:EpsG family protein [Stutzerimonas balearica]|uniref:EpsG family protein n=1 Tax=Stutzerimonas balearica TaxID=74829 RepID=UPI003F76D164